MLFLFISCAQNGQQSYSKIIRNFDPLYHIENLFFFQEISNVGQQNQYNMSRAQAFREICSIIVKLKFQAGSQTLANGLGNGICLTKAIEQQIRSVFQDKLAKFLENKQFSLPEYDRHKRLYDTRMKIRSTNFQQCLPSIEDKGIRNLQSQMKTFQIMRQQLQEQEKKIKMAINEKKNINLSQFILQFIRLIRKDNIRFQLSLSILKEQSNKRMLIRLEQLRERYLQQQSLEFKEKYKSILADYISIDNIIQQFNYFKKASLNSASDSTDYYQKCLNTSWPFSLIDGLTNNFGNQLLQTFLERFNQINYKKNVFVVSVVGSKESGKSSILSHLFPRSIYFEQNPFTKGVYMSVHQVNNKTVVVLDVLGIVRTIPNPKYTSQQLRTQFALFDHQCISLLMKQSDLAIFTSSIKQDQQQRISLAFGTYLTIINAFAVNNQQKNIIPKNVIFAFSDVTDIKTDKKQIIESLIGRIQPILMKISMEQHEYNNIRSLFNKYVYLTQQDIFFLPKEYQDNFSIERTKDQEYGLHILALRSRVMRKIHEIQELGLSSRTIIDFYQNAKVSWQTILLTTEKIASTISIEQLYQKLFIDQIYRKKYSQIYRTITISIEERYEFEHLKKRITIPSNYPLGSIYQIYGQLLDIINSQEQTLQDSWDGMEKKAFSSFRNQCLAITRQIELLINFSRLNFQRIFNSLAYDHLKYQYLGLENGNYINCLQKQFVQLYQQININKISDKDFINFTYQQKVKQLFDSFFMNRQGDKAKIFQQKTQLFRNFIIILSSQNIFKNLQIEDIKDCTDFDEKNSLKYLNKFIHFQNQGQISQEDKASLIEALEKNINSFQNLIKDNIFNDIYHIQHQVNQTINKTIQETNKQIQSQAQQIYSPIDSKKENLEIQEAIAKKIVNVIQNLKRNGDNSQNLEIMKQYYEIILYRINNKSVERKIHLNRINLKAVLLGKLFKRLYNSIDENYGNDIEMKKKKFQRKAEEAKVHIII